MLNAPGRLGSLGAAGQAAEAPALSVVITPSNRAWVDEGDYFLTNLFTATVSNAVGTVSFAWELLTGDAGNFLTEGEPGQVATPNVATRNQVENDDTWPESPGAGTLRVTVTADNGVAVSNTATFS